jgi:hypothetical protein
MRHRRSGALGLIAAVVLAAGCGRAPEMGPDRETFKTVDALYTAVSLRDTVQLDRCAATLEGLRAAERLPGRAHGALAGIIGVARQGEWESARQELRDFMLDQRR